MYRILVCDDEKDIRNALRIFLTGEGYEVIEAENGEEALNIAVEQTFHLALMDIMMPGMDGLTATAKLREISHVPVILLTAKSEDNDKILGLTVGADDYITKPFNPLEVIARVKAQLRRIAWMEAAEKPAATYALGGIRLDDEGKTVTLDGEAVNLTPTEFDILHMLMEHPGKVFSSAEIYRQVWKDTPLASEGTVAVHIRHLREKLEIDPANPRHIKVVWGKGYKLEGGK